MFKLPSNSCKTFMYLTYHTQAGDTSARPCMLYLYKHVHYVYDIYNASKMCHSLFSLFYDLGIINLFSTPSNPTYLVLLVPPPFCG